jgi:integrase/recombinase XerD
MHIFQTGYLRKYGMGMGSQVRECDWFSFDADTNWWGPGLNVGRATGARAPGLRDRGPILLNSGDVRMDRRAATRRLRRLAQATGLQARLTRTCSATFSSPPCLMSAWTFETSRSLPATPTRAPRCARVGPHRARTNLDLHPNYILAAYRSSIT